METLIYAPFVHIVETPILALIPTVVFVVLAILAGRNGRTYLTWLAALLWFTYAAYEIGLNAFDLLGGEPIRIDLLAIAPILWIASAAALASYLASTIRSARR